MGPPLKIFVCDVLKQTILDYIDIGLGSFLHISDMLESLYIGKGTEMVRAVLAADIYLCEYV